MALICSTGPLSSSSVVVSECVAVVPLPHTNSLTAGHQWVAIVLGWAIVLGPLFSSFRISSNSTAAVHCICEQAPRMMFSVLWALLLCSCSCAVFYFAAAVFQFWWCSIILCRESGRTFVFPQSLFFSFCHCSRQIMDASVVVVMFEYCWNTMPWLQSGWLTGWPSSLNSRVHHWRGGKVLPEQEPGCPPDYIIEHWYLR